MKRVFAVAGKAMLLEVPEPELRAGEVLVSPAYSVISSGTEMHIIHSSADPRTLGDDTYPSLRQPNPPQLRGRGIPYTGPMPRPQRPGTASLGYSLAGTVVAVSPEVSDMKVGDRVACSGNQAAVHAELVSVPRTLTAHLPAELPLDQAAFVTLGAIAMEGVRRTFCGLGETIVISGLGLLGLLSTQIARSSGIYVLGLDVDDRRLNQAIAFGANQAINPTKSDPTACILGMTDGFGADGVVMCTVTSSSDPINLAFDLCRQRARVVCVGSFGMDIDRGKMFSRDVTLVASIAYGSGRYDHEYEEGNRDYPIGFVRWTENRNQSLFLRMLVEGAVKLDGLAPVRFAMKDAGQAYDLLHAPDRPATVILTYGKHR